MRGLVVPRGGDKEIFHTARVVSTGSTADQREKGKDKTVQGNSTNREGEGKARQGRAGSAKGRDNSADSATTVTTVKHSTAKVGLSWVFFFFCRGLPHAAKEPLKCSQETHNAAQSPLAAREHLRCDQASECPVFEVPRASNAAKGPGTVALHHKVRLLLGLGVEYFHDFDNIMLIRLSRTQCKELRQG